MFLLPCRPPARIWGPGPRPCPNPHDSPQFRRPDRSVAGVQSPRKAERPMASGAELHGRDLEQFRPYLVLLARQHWDDRLQARMDAADLVQQTLLEAQQKLHQFRGTSDRELAGWLRTALAHNLADARNKV